MNVNSGRSGNLRNMNLRNMNLFSNLCSFLTNVGVKLEAFAHFVKVPHVVKISSWSVTLSIKIIEISGMTKFQAYQPLPEKVKIWSIPLIFWFIHENLSQQNVPVDMFPVSTRGSFLSPRKANTFCHFSFNKFVHLNIYICLIHNFFLCIFFSVCFGNQFRRRDVFWALKMITIYLWLLF